MSIMKTTYNTLMVAVLTFLFFSCSTPFLEVVPEAPTDTEIEDDKLLDGYIRVGLKVGGSELPSQDMPLAKNGGSKTLYGIQVYEEKTDEVYFFSTLTKVGYAIFDDPSKLILQLPPNKKFYMQVAYCPDGQDVIWKNNGGYGRPFAYFTEGSPIPMNEFILNRAADLMIDLPWSYIEANKGKTSSFNEVNYYFGIVHNYTPVENGVISVDLKRMVFGLTFNIKKNDKKTYNKILISLNADVSYDVKKFYVNMDNSKEITTVLIPYLMMDMNYESMGSKIRYSNMLRGDVPAENKISMTIGMDDNPSEIYSGFIRIKRNLMHVYDFDAMPNFKVDNTIKPNYEQTPMGNQVSVFE